MTRLDYKEIDNSNIIGRWYEYIFALQRMVTEFNQFKAWKKGL